MLTVCIIPTDQVTSTDKKKLAEYAQIRFLRWMEQEYRLTKNTLKISKKENGIPYIEGYPMLHLSRSYCRECAVYALGTGCVGIDVEEIRTYNKYLAEQFYCESELEDLSPQNWTKLWTLKEAFAKYLETGLGGIRGCRIPVKELIEVNKLKITDIKVNRYCICSLISDTDEKARRFTL